MVMRWNFPIIDADSHIVEPVDLWEKYVPSKYHSRVPKVVPMELRGHADTGLKFEYLKEPIPLRGVGGAGKSEFEWDQIRNAYTEGRKGAFDPTARIPDMDRDGIEAQVLFPGYMLNGPSVASHDPEIQNACVEGYNNWMSDFCSHDPDRLWGIALIPVSGIDDAVSELERARKLPGIRGALLTAWPNGSETKADFEADNRFWAAAADLDIGVTVHLGFQGAPLVIRPEEIDFGVLAALARTSEQAMPIVASLLLSGVFERHPKLRLSFVEVGAGWLPYFLGELDNIWTHHRHTKKGGSMAYTLRIPPSESWCRQGFATIMTDRFAIANWENPILLDSVCWSTDYPHTLGPWPNSRDNIESQMATLPEQVRHKFLNENVARLYGATRTAVTGGMIS